MKDKKVTVSGMNRFTRGKSCLIKPTALYSEITGKSEEDRNLRAGADRPDCMCCHSEGAQQPGRTDC